MPNDFFFLITVSHKNILRPQNLMVLILWISQDTNKKKAANNFYSESEEVQIPSLNEARLYIWKGPVSPFCWILLADILFC